VDTNFYDVVVCGGETTGLVAGALLARRGLRVLLLGHEGDHAAFEAGGATLSRAPALLPPLDDPPAARVLKELDHAAVVRRRAPAARPALRVVLPGQQIDLSPDAAATERELGRAFGATSAAVGAALGRLGEVGRLVEPLLASAITLPPHGFWERREVGRFESLLPRAGTDLHAPLAVEHPFRAVAAAPAALSTGLVPHEIGMVAETRALELARRGAHVLDGGLAGLHDILLGRFETFGGDQRRRLTPVEVVVRRGRAVGVRVLPRDETIGCHRLIWAGSAGSLQAALGDAAPSGDRRGVALRVAGYRHALAALCEPGAVPDGTPPRLIAIGDPSRPLTEDNAVAVTVGSAGARADRIPVWVECVVPTHAVEAGAGYLRALRGRLLHVLARLLPTLPPRLALCASPYDGLPAEGRAVPAAEAPSHSGRPLIPPAVYALSVPRAFDVMGLPHETGIKHLTLASRENLPGLGLEGELVSGWGLARLIARGQARPTTPQRRMLLGD
jgi:phytoene dehydrogenase-like protein